jgi:hypothetical protein
MSAAPEWTAALRRALARRDNNALDALADVLVAAAAAGERWALEHIADRLEGRPVQRVEASIRAPGPDLARVADIRERLRAARPGKSPPPEK